QGNAISGRWRSGNLPRAFYFYHTARPASRTTAVHGPGAALSILDDRTAVTLVPSRRGPVMTPPSAPALPAADLATLQAMEGAADAHVDLLLPDANGVLRGKDRKSTRLNSSHVKI